MTKPNNDDIDIYELLSRADELLEEKEFREITVSDICKQTGLNRSTFYANFEDLYALAEHIRHQLEGEFAALFDPLPTLTHSETGAALRMFTHIYENQPAYRTYFKLGFADRNNILQYDLQRAEQDFHSEHIDYHITFFRAGFNALVQRWLSGGCTETPEEMTDILKAEYRGR